MYSAADSVNVAGKVAVIYVATNASCTPTTELESASGGNVTLTRVDDDGYGGSFDVTFDNGDHVNGNFFTTRCAALTPNLGETCV